VLLTCFGRQGCFLSRLKETDPFLPSNFGEEIFSVISVVLLSLSSCPNWVVIVFIDNIQQDVIAGLKHCLDSLWSFSFWAAFFQLLSLI